MDNQLKLQKKQLIQEATVSDFMQKKQRNEQNKALEQQLKMDAVNLTGV